MKVANSKCRGFVQNKVEFTGSNLFGVFENKKYVVYSYGRHFPLFVFDGKWYGNSDRYSVSTSKQYGQAHPHTEMEMVNTVELKNIIRG